MKKLLVISAIAALGLSSVAFAGGFGEEMPATPAATDAGFYLGVEGGWGLTNWKDTGNAWGYAPQLAVDKDNGFVARGFLGYDFTRYFAIEAGYTYFFNKPNVSDSTGTYATSSIKTSSIDLLGKIKAPIVDNFDLFAKLGGSYLMSRSDAGTIVSGNVNNFCLAFGAGADYYITPNVIANLEWLRFTGHSKFDTDTSNVDRSSYQPATDAFMIGLRYKFDM